MESVQHQYQVLGEQHRDSAELLDGRVSHGNLLVVHFTV